MVIITTFYGVWRFYSPIPFWDQWNGSIGLYVKIREGDWGALWAQHNEHRIVFSRLLFLLDYWVFGGVNIFTVFCNMALLALTGWTMWSAGDDNRVWRASVVGALMFSWVQNENMTWGFESQCIAVNLFAFLAFRQLARAERRVLHMWPALLFCALSTVSMGNGFSSFFVAAIQLFLFRRPLKECFIMIAGGIVASAVYFWHYTPYVLPPASGSAVSFAPLKYFAIFVGNPFFWVHGSNLLITALIGIALLSVGAASILYLFFTRQVTPYRSFLIACYGFTVASALAASHSRWMLGLDSATASRYTTPTLMGYAALALLMFDIARSSRWRTAVIGMSTVALLALATTQLAAIRSDNSGLFSRKLALLGQKIGIDHPGYDAVIYPAPLHDLFAQLATDANAYQIGPWSKGWLHDAGLVQFDPSRIDPSLCRGTFDTNPKDEVAYRATGWVVADKYQSGDVLVLITQDGKTVGYGVSGLPREDVRKVVPGAPLDTGWIGFSRVGESTQAFAYLGGKFCPLGAPAVH
ncbi:hypothetical protein [Paraburkholderia sp. J11-2]|uniref:hypothetical protein n=1 Tax=Paraburkholderia sp. J11-2 TaxID=2805431 RepID=UPI002AB6D0D1|nr:hypothetical protein [Paraburkholderia sp. J11-2]